MSGATSAVVLAGTAIASTVIAADGRSRAAQSQATQANYSAQVARNNQLAVQRTAGLVRQQGESDAQKQQLKTAALIGSQRAALASQGGDIDSGSPLDIAGDTARAGFSDTAAIRNNAAWKAYGYELQANDAGAQASDADFQAATATANLPNALGSSLLSSASSLGRTL
jgi:hypothetical protein